MNILKNKQAFTLVELIVVITILSILSTIWFVSYSSYISWSRDATRIASLKSISEWLHLYSTKNNLPLPDETSVKIMDGITQIWTQWYVWENVLETIEYSTKWKDPKEGTYYSYYLTKNKKYFQLMAFLEDNSNLQTTSSAIDYEIKYPTVFWKRLWILITSTNIPIQETGITDIDISNVWNLELKSYLNDNEYLSWTGTTFKNMTTFWKVWWKFCSTNNLSCISSNITISCPSWFIAVPWNISLNTKEFCVAQYEMTYNDANTPDSIWWWGDWNTMHYDSTKTIVSMAWKYPITDLTQAQAIFECNKIWAHLITNNEWMTIARNIEWQNSNWSDWSVWNWYLYDWVSWDIDLWCNEKWWNSESRDYATVWSILRYRFMM